MSVSPGLPAQNTSVAVAPSGGMALWLYKSRRTWKFALAIAIVMVVLALIGVGLSTSNRASAPTYWMILVPVYGVLSTAVAWFRARDGEGGAGIVVRQVVHWFCIAGAVAIDFYMRGSGEVSGSAAGLTALLLLALGCLLAGVHFELLFVFVGLLLLSTLVLVVKADQYLWLVFLAGAAGIAAMIWVLRYLHRRSPSPHQPGRP